MKRSKYKGFCVFLLDRIVLVLLKYGENKAKKGKNIHFYELESLAK